MSSGRSIITLRERRSPSSSEEEQRDNPFAPPPEDAPEQPWQPRGPEGSPDSAPEGGGERSGWGSRWSDRQPGRQDGGLGSRPDGDRDRGQGQGNGPNGPAGLRFDPTDPAQRRARYALLSGMWGLFCGLLGWTPISLLLGALALYWGGSSLRAKPRPAVAAIDAPPPPPDPAPAESAQRPQRAAAWSGIVTGGLALVIVATTFTFHVVYKDYFTCAQDALTTSSRQSCERLLPKQLRPVFAPSE